MKFLSKNLKKIVSNCSKNGLNHYQKSFTKRNMRYMNLGDRSTSNLLLSPAEATKILRTNESTVDIQSKCSIKYYDANYLGANSPIEDRQTSAKFLYSDTYLFGVFDGHGVPLKDPSNLFKHIILKNTFYGIYPQIWKKKVLIVTQTSRSETHLEVDDQFKISFQFKDICTQHLKLKIKFINEFQISKLQINKPFELK
ncbi:pyruvate dehydrogenase [acetyl-transferring]-phosphatase mitochondrial [Brachionus plicatilis]|uniref:Pyruvate dehydrogenase [acetyl-transferring]-phosphatase mitochondrial n=1 Tax=Brachionus plicatilis TaxID=10195 RepID=A0A3M7S5F9_BRAPC|nr:pyruvate dehydrogenase [acetyl-transferring]-phosphatase mitochondrial [Brachionus plicatilis]